MAAAAPISPIQAKSSTPQATIQRSQAPLAITRRDQPAANSTKGPAATAEISHVGRQFAAEQSTKSTKAKATSSPLAEGKTSTVAPKAESKTIQTGTASGVKAAAAAAAPPREVPKPESRPAPAPVTAKVAAPAAKSTPAASPASAHSDLAGGPNNLGPRDAALVQRFGGLNVRSHG